MGDIDMQKLFADLAAFSEVLVNFQYELEDNYESPVLEKRLAEFRARIKEFLNYTPTFNGNSLEQSEQKYVAGQIMGDLSYSLRALEGINKNTKVFDIIDVLKDTYATLVRHLPNNDYVGGYDN